MLQCLSEPGVPSIREILEPFLVNFRKASTLLAELQCVDPSHRASEGLNPSGSASERLRPCLPGRGNPFPASGPFAPAGRGKRATCLFADDLVVVVAIIMLYSKNRQER